MAEVAELEPQFPSIEVAPVLEADVDDVLDAVDVVADVEAVEEVDKVSVLSPQVPNPL